MHAHMCTHTRTDTHTNTHAHPSIHPSILCIMYNAHTQNAINRDARFVKLEVRSTSEVTLFGVVDSRSKPCVKPTY